MQTAASSRYASVAIALHWTIALAIIVMLWLGWNMHDADHRPVEWMFQLHKSIGITILTLTIARIIWRLMNPPPPLPDGMKPLEKTASHATHIGLYVLMIAMPLTGWVMVSVSPFSIATVLYGTTGWPHLPGLPDLALESRENIYPFVVTIHESLARLMAGLAILHVAGAIKHEISDEEGVLKRMIPALFGKPAPPRPPSRGALNAFGAAAVFFVAVAGAPVVAQSLSGKPAPAQSKLATANWDIDYANSEIRFSGIYDEDDFTGTFEDWTASISFSKDALASSHAEVTIETSSARTGNTQYDSTLEAGEWFATNTFPAASVSLTNFRTEGDGLVADAALTIKEIALTLPFVFTLDDSEDTVVMTGTTTLSRAAYDIGQDSDAEGEWVSDEITVSVTVRATKSDG